MRGDEQDEPRPRISPEAGSWTAGADPAVPHLCERCWFPILPGETARRTPVHVSSKAFSARLVSFVHCAPSCTPQIADADEDRAA